MESLAHQTPRGRRSRYCSSHQKHLLLKIGGDVVIEVDTKLLVRPVARSGELAQAVLLRVSGDNALSSPRSLATLGWRGDNLAECLKGGLTPQGPINGLGPLNRSAGNRVPSRFWTLRRSRFCPICLQEALFWKAEWGLCFTVACPIHKVKLADRCSCGKELRWTRQNLHSCTCGEDLRCLSTEPASKAAIYMSAEIQTAGETCWSDPSVNAADHLCDLLHRIWLLGAHVVGTGVKRKQLSDLHDCRRATEVVEAAGSVLGHWPEAFFELLDELSAGIPPSKSNRVAAAFGPVYRDMYAKGTWRAFTMLRESFEQYVRLRWTGQVAKRNRRLGDEAATEHVWMPATRAAKELGWRAPRLRRAITAGILRGHVRALPSGRTMSVAHREDVDQVKKEQLQWVDMSSVCRILRIGKRRAKELMQMERLRPVAGPSVDGSSVWRFRQIDVTELARTLKTETPV